LILLSRSRLVSLPPPRRVRGSARDDSDRPVGRRPDGPVMSLGGPPAAIRGVVDRGVGQETRNDVPLYAIRRGFRYSLFPECHEDSQKPFIGNLLRSSARGTVMR